jgi:hypothetical protein
LNLGGFVIYYAPQVPIFIDDRCELYGNEFLREYDRVARHDPEFVDNWARRFGFDVALTHPGSPIDGFFRNPSHGWRVVAECDAATLYERDTRAEHRTDHSPRSGQPTAEAPN